MARMRSPNFPQISLGQAIDLVGKIHREDRTNSIDKEVAAKHMGYTGLTGRTLKLLGALSQFGLLEKVGKGQVRVSKTAVSILHWGTEEEKREALAKAGASPALFRRIRGTFENPSDRTVTSYLIKEGFTDSAIPAVLKSYKETNRFLADAGVSESYGNGGDGAPESSLDLEDEEEETVIEDPQRNFQKTVQPAPEEDGLRLNFDLHSISVSGRTSSPAELREFVAKLSALQDLFQKFATRDVENALEEEE